MAINNPAFRDPAFKQGGGAATQAMTAQRWASTDALGSSTRGVRTTTGALTGSP